ncbi:transposase [Paracoccus marinaquae]|uniref:transposase n=1 Tax=Paracoccus marinaquae TaxID=2841926 RepID=UPI002090A491|nr:transposase [Paracoccus marinaquae]
MSRRKKRFWADEEKREICAQATTPGMSVAQVARRYAVNANLIFKWLKDPRFAPRANEPKQET